jgi:hypothetical protein
MAHLDKNFFKVIRSPIFILLVVGFVGITAYAFSDKQIEDSGISTQPESRTQVETASKPVQQQAPQSPKASSEICSQRSIPYLTTTKYDPNLTKGIQYPFGGLNGTEYYCTGSNGAKRVTATIPPIDKTITIGTAAPVTFTLPASPTGSASSPKYSYSEAYSLAQHNCAVKLGNAGAGNSSGMQPCIAAYMQSYGY